MTTIEDTDDTGRWTLTVKFDPIEVVYPGDYDWDDDEADRFIAELRKMWSLEPEDVTELIKRDGDAVHVKVDLIDHAISPTKWLILNAVPKSIALTRNEGR